MSFRSNFFIIFGSDDDHDLVNLYHASVCLVAFVVRPLSGIRHQYLSVLKTIDIVFVYIKINAHFDFIYALNLDQDASIKI
jgi:hypothetical protein